MAKKILVIDDDETLRSMVCHTLSKRGHEVLQAEDGEECLSLARKHLPALVICDVKMEKVDGYQALETLRADQSTASIPFILMTADADKAGMRQGMSMGADDYLAKPFSAADLLAAVEAQHRKALIRTRQADQKLAELRSNLNLSLPHELYTPLNGIIGYGDLLQTMARSLPPEEIEEMARSILVSAQRLQRLVQNYLFYAQIESIASDAKQCEVLRTAQSGPIALDLETTSVKEASATKRVSDLVLSVAEANVAISAEFLLKIVSELVQNAFKFSESGTVVRLTTNVGPEGFALEVQNYGPGFKPEQIANIGAYTQFGRKLHEQQGLGLGLVIAKRLTELHNGRFGIISDSELSQTSIRVTLPVADPNEPLWTEAASL